MIESRYWEERKMVKAEVKVKESRSKRRIGKGGAIVAYLAKAVILANFT